MQQNSDPDRDTLRRWLYEPGQGHIEHISVVDTGGHPASVLARLDEPSIEAIRQLIREEVHRALHPEREQLANVVTSGTMPDFCERCHFLSPTEANREWARTSPHLMCQCGKEETP